MTESRKAKREPPRFRGVTTHRDRLGRYSIRYPSDWYVQIGDEGSREGITFFPTADDPRTFFDVWVRELERGVVAGDLDEARAGAQDGLDLLPGISVEFFDEIVLDNLIKIELVYTFESSGLTLKRKSWILFVERWQLVLTFQASSPVEYEYWLAMANYSFETFDLPPELWFATDRELASRYAKEPGDALAADPTPATTDHASADVVSSNE